MRLLQKGADPIIKQQRQNKTPLLFLLFFHTLSCLVAKGGVFLFRHRKLCTVRQSDFKAADISDVSSVPSVRVTLKRQIFPMCSGLTR